MGKDFKSLSVHTHNKHYLQLKNQPTPLPGKKNPQNQMEGKKVLFISWSAHSILVLENQGDNFWCIVCADSAVAVQLLQLQVGCKAR